MAWADEIKEIKAICHCGKKATMNARVDSTGKMETEASKSRSVETSVTFPFAGVVFPDPTWVGSELTGSLPLRKFDVRAKAFQIGLP